MGAYPVTAAHVRSLREYLLHAFRQADRPDGLRPPAETARWTAGLSAADLRVGLAWLATLSASPRASSSDVQLWMDTSALRGIRVPVRTWANRLGISARHAHRRVQAVDDAVAALLRTTSPQEFVHLARPIGIPPAGDELVELARADSHLASEPNRLLDALAMYLRNRAGARAIGSPPRYLDDNKDTRYRDSGRVAVWMKTLAGDPPLPFTTTTDERQLAVVTGAHLAEEPADALAQVGAALTARRREGLPLLLAHAGKLIHGPSAAGVQLWLGLLQLRYHAAMEAEHIVGLRYARALAADAARLSPNGVGDPQVRRGLSGCGHILQMFGHYDAALAYYTRAARHVAHFPGSTDDEVQVAHDIYAQVAYTEALRGGRREVADKALRRVHAFADRHGDNVHIQFTRQRRVLEASLGFMASRDELRLQPTNRRAEAALAADFDRFLEIASLHPSPNRHLSSHDISLLYGILTRDAGLAATARAEFQALTERSVGYANLSHRFNSRLRTATTLSSRFSDIEPVTEPLDPLRELTTSPKNATGLLIGPP